MKKLIFLMLFLVQSQSFADTLGRLFFTKQEREAMDRRSRNPGKATEANPEASGTVQRKDGGETVWINGVPHHVERDKKK